MIFWVSDYQRPAHPVYEHWDKQTNIRWILLKISWILYFWVRSSFLTLMIISEVLSFLSSSYYLSQKLENEKIIVPDVIGVILPVSLYTPHHILKLKTHNKYVTSIFSGLVNNDNAYFAFCSDDCHAFWCTGK